MGVNWNTADLAPKKPATPRKPAAPPKEPRQPAGPPVAKEKQPRHWETDFLDIRTTTTVDDRSRTVTICEPEYWPALLAHLQAFKP